MEKINIKTNVGSMITGIVGLCLIAFIAFSVIRQPVQPIAHANTEIHPNSLCPLLSNDKKQTTDEERVARHFAADTLPGLIKKGMIKKYQRTVSGTYIAVNGNLWKRRSSYFKRCLLKEVLVYNTFNGYAISTQIVDSTSGKLYAQIAPSATMDFYE
jgi:hypothetical protein